MSKKVRFKNIMNYEEIRDEDRFQYEDICNRIAQYLPKKDSEGWAPMRVGYLHDNHLIIYFDNGHSVTTNGDGSSRINLRFDEIIGFENLSVEAEETFINTYNIHSLVPGVATKIQYIPKRLVEIENGIIEVWYDAKGKSNGNWLHYTPDGEWY